jgi:hypothetical protein
MTTWQRIFVSPNVVEVEAGIGRQIIQCERTSAKIARKLTTPGLTPAQRRSLLALEREIAGERRALALIARDNRQQLNDLAAKTAGRATTSIRERLAATAERPDTGVKPHLADLIESAPLLPNTGAVGIASETKLDRAVNPNTPGYGPYWRAQEYGTGSTNVPPGTKAVPSQIGRKKKLYGYFYETGVTSPSRPQAQYAGGRGPHPIFIPSSGGQRGARGGGGGVGVIRHEIQPRHFIRDGADRAVVQWRREMSRIDTQTAKALSAAPALAKAVTAAAAARPSGRRRLPRGRRR